jgi:CBS domain-containing protein
MKVAEIMTSGPLTIAVEESAAAAAELMRDGDVSALIVTDGRGVRGVVTDHDITVRVVAAQLDPRTTALTEFVAPDVVAVSPGDDIDTAVELMQGNALRRLPVLDGEHLVGVVSLGDVAIDQDNNEPVAGD